MEIDKWYPERGTNIFENDFLNFYFLKVDVSLTMQDPNFKLYIYKTLLWRELCLRFFIRVLVHFIKNLEKNIQKNK